MSIMDIFKTQPKEGNDNQNNNNNNQAVQKGLSDSSPAVGADGKIPGSEPAPVNPLDAYKKMYENANTNSDIQAPTFKIDSKVLGEVSSSMDFTKGIQPDLMEKALSGDVKSLLGVIQQVGRNSYSASLEHATALTDTHLGQRADFENKRVNAGVRKELTSNELSTAPNYSHPVIKAELNRVADMFAKANPDSSPQEIAKAAQEHLMQISQALSPVKSQEQQNADKGEVDWSKYLAG
ncbi:MAG: hypothetical protein ACD_86C00001G0002 [uncultured bacterium]|nr:MAG: hypothetical protein ACD_86C00001G0002 [uncultured bacterium]